MSTTWFDLETFSVEPITSGSHKYAEHAEILLFAYAIDNGPVQCWDVTASAAIPDDLLASLRSGGDVWGHNMGMFDMVVLKHAMPDVFALVDVTRWRDTMVQALCHALPASLGTLCEVFHLGEDVAKDKRGKQLIQRFCKPTKTGRNTQETHPAEWSEFIEYAKSDILAMRVLQSKMPQWNYPNNKFELSLWHLDQKINMRGVQMDIDLASKAVDAVAQAQAALTAACVDATDGEVGAATQRAKLLSFLFDEHGVHLPDLKKTTVAKYLAKPKVSDEVRELLEIRQEASTSSVAKYKKIMVGVSRDERLRGLLQFSGASRTQRFSGKFFQPQNLARPSVGHEEIEGYIAAIKANAIDLVTDNVMAAASNCMRGTIIAPDNMRLVVSDLSNIEGRAAAFLAGETWKIKAFYEFDAGTGPDLYKLSYAKAFKVDVSSVTKDQRQIGKVMELAFSYGSGVSGFTTFAAAYGINLAELAERVLPTLPNDVLDEAIGFYDWSIKTKRDIGNMPKDSFVVCESLKRVWRRAHPAIVGMWAALDATAKIAVDHSTGRFVVNEHIAFDRTPNWLKMSLPSGDFLSYAAPKEEEGQVTYMGISQFTRKWTRQRTYGGKWLENLCQKFSRNIMVHNMPEIEAAGYQIVLSVHDELITQAPDNNLYSEAALSNLLSRNVIWSAGMPLAAAGFEAYRYRKD